MIQYTHFDSPVGSLLLVGRDGRLLEIRFPRKDGSSDPDPGWVESARPFDEAKRQLDAYFKGRLEEFDLDLAPEGTPFQLRVWGELRKIPYGETISYGELARRVGNPKASRAVGAANGRNPISIVVPCHRVIGSSGSLTGFGGGLDRKRTLLDLESQTRQPTLI
jgi:methylated-DNA-[protein]-cysteine S-methyltransferase